MMENVSPTWIEIFGTIIFVVAIVHTFITSYFQRLANLYPAESWQQSMFHFLGEVEIVFGLWAGILVVCMVVMQGWASTLEFTNTLHFNEPIFVFVVMTVASTKPIIDAAQRLIIRIAFISPVYRFVVTYFLCLFLGPLLGSLITEPAAMTVTALILYNRFYSRSISKRFQYITIAVLFVNVSIGGVLTNYAAPPVLMVADTWQWSSSYMFFTFGWKAMIGVAINAAMATALLFSELCELEINEPSDQQNSQIPHWLTGIHFVFLTLIVITSHHSVFCMGIFLFFLGFTTITSLHQDELKIRQSLLVAFFLAGLVVLGSFQSWWLSPLLSSLQEFSLFVGSTILTSFTDNAALTYLGSKVENLSEILKYALVSGAVAGGGLTVIANAPNPAGFSILQKSFGPEGIRPGKLFVFALVPTIIAMLCFWFL